MRWHDGTRGWLVAAFCSYVVTFAAFAFPWLRHIGDSITTYPNRFDAQLIAWVLSWVTHALVDPDARLFDANIYHPAPDQLTGSEHLLFLQLLFAPLYLLTKQPAAATGVVAFITYPLGALAMAALLLKLGCSRVVAWVCGLAYAVGILRAPFNFHVLQYPNLFLPLVALVAVRIRSAGALQNGFWLFLVLLAALLTSYYIAAIVCVTLGLWAFAALLISRRHAARFIITIALALLAAGAVAGLLLRPYLTRSAGMFPGKLPWDHAGHLWAYTLFAVGYWYNSADTWRIPFALLALLGLGGRGDQVWRRTALFGTVLCLCSAALVIFGLPESLGQLAAYTPLRNLRGWPRLLVITDFGLCLLAAAGLDVFWRRFGMRAAIVPIAAFTLLATLPRLLWFCSGLTDLPPALGERVEAYRTVKRYTDDLGRGPLLELPSGMAIDCEAMLGSTFHWLPLLNGFTGYAPPHTRVMRAAASALPDDGALQQLVDLGHLRWILVRPDKDWGNPRTAEHVRQGLRASSLIGRRFSFDGFTLFEVTAPARRPRWYPAIAAGPQPGSTALGTPIRRLAPAEAIATVEAVGEIVGVPGFSTIKVRVRNAGTADWPVLLEGPALQFGELGTAQVHVTVPLTVHLEARWTPLAQTGLSDEPLVHNVLLDRDVLASETIVQSLLVPKQLSPGRYRLDVRVAQKDGPEFIEPPSRMLHEIVELQARRTTRTARDAKTWQRSFDVDAVERQGHL